MCLEFVLEAPTRCGLPAQPLLRIPWVAADLFERYRRILLCKTRSAHVPAWTEILPAAARCRLEPGCLVRILARQTASRAILSLCTAVSLAPRAGCASPRVCHRLRISRGRLESRLRESGRAPRCRSSNANLGQQTSSATGGRSTGESTSRHRQWSGPVLPGRHHFTQSATSTSGRLPWQGPPCYLGRDRRTRNTACRSRQPRMVHTLVLRCPAGLDALMPPTRRAPRGWPAAVRPVEINFSYSAFVSVVRQYLWRSAVCRAKLLWFLQHPPSLRPQYAHLSPPCPAPRALPPVSYGPCLARPGGPKARAH